MIQFINVEVTEAQNIYCRKFRTYGKIIKIIFTYDPTQIEFDIIDIFDSIEEKFDEIINKLKENFD